MTAYPSLIEAGKGGNGCPATTSSANTQFKESTMKILHMNEECVYNYYILA